MKYQKRKKMKPLWLVLVADVLLTGVILVIFAFFHHVLPQMVSNYEWQQAQLNATEPAQTSATGMTERLATAAPTDSMETVGQTEPTEVTEPDTRTDWQKKFEEHFTDEVVQTSNSYSSPEVSVTVETIKTTVNGNPISYYLADIYIASIDNFQTYTAYGDVIYYGVQNPVSMTKDTNAIVAINGDYITVQKNGFLVRNSVVYASDRNNSICVLYPDGTMEAYDQGTYVLEDILAREPVQVWSFGPSLLDENGQAKEAYDMLSGVNGVHPRSALGYYEPGHYCFVVVDGRQNHSVGLRMNQLAQIFEDLGCTMAYNMDGGASAVMMFDQKVTSRQSSQRDLGDILLITDSYYKQENLAQEGAE